MNAKNLTASFCILIFYRMIQGYMYSIKLSLAKTGTVQGSFREKHYQELGLESLKSRRWYKRLRCMYKIREKKPNYLTNLILKSHQPLRTRTNRTTTFYCRTDCFKNSFFPSALSDWFELDFMISSSQSISIFKSRLLSFIHPIQTDAYNIFDPVGLKFLTRLRLDFGHLNEHTFRHIFQDCLNPLCSCSLETEDAKHYLLTCHRFFQQRIDLINSVNYIF